MKTKNTVIYASHFELIENLTNEQAGELFKIIGRFVNDEEINIQDPTVNGIWMVIKQNFITQLENYNKVCQKNKENGKKGGRPKQQKTDDLSNSIKETEQPIVKEEIIEQNEPEELIQEVVVKEEQEEVISTVNIIEDEVVEDSDEDEDDDEDEVIPTVKEIKPIQKKVIEEYVKPKEDRRPSLNGIDYAYASGPIDVDVLTRANEFFSDLSEINFEDKFVNIEKEFSKDQMLHLVFQINNIISGYNKEQVSGKLKELAFKK